jgi:hypothetical protein
MALGFSWIFDGQNSLHTYVGGDFRPVVWPSSSTKRISYTVLVNGEAWSFPRNWGITSNFDVPAIMLERGIENGWLEATALRDANNANTGNLPLEVGPLEWDAYTTGDESRYFVRSHWKLVNRANPSAYSNLYAGQRMFLIEGSNTIWTDCKGVNHFTNAWGDHVTSTESGLTYATPYPDQLAGGTIVIKNENHPDQTITLTLKLDHLDVTNTLGLPTVHMPGHWNYTQRSTREILAVPETIYDVGFVPTSMQLQSQGDTNTTVTTTFEWTGGGIAGVFPPLKSVTHPNGYKESFTYSPTPIKKPADYAFDPTTGNWVGFRPQSNLVWGSYQYQPVAKVTKLDTNGTGSTVVITRESPDWTEAAQSTWLQTKHTTTIQTFPTPDGTGLFRQVKLTHPGFDGTAVPDGIWGNPSRATDAEAQAAYLFATGAVLKAELFDEAGSVYRTAIHLSPLSLVYGAMGHKEEALRMTLVALTSPAGVANTLTVASPGWLPLDGFEGMNRWIDYTTSAGIGASSGMFKNYRFQSRGRIYCLAIRGHEYRTTHNSWGGYESQNSRIKKIPIN